VDNHSFVLHTNSVYKTGGTLYLGGFHSENYYSPDVPAYICFCCLKPSIYGGETGLINTKSVYDRLDPSLQQRLENNNFMASLWLVSEVAQRYQLSTHVVEEVCQRFHLPLVGSGANRFIVMYKPNVFVHPDTGTKAFQINFFEIKELNRALRRFFAPDYPGKRWFWHRFFWRLPSFMLSVLEKTYMSIASFIHSPKDSLNILRFKWRVFNALKANPGLTRASNKVDSCFSDQEVNELARLMREHYSSCLWQTGDILLIDNRQVAHAGMPGAGSRLVRAIICNPLDMQYDANQSGLYNSQNKDLGTIAAFIQSLKK
jgi:alpha-ketoglutarate-dependent taurine dioxygenase